MIAPRRIRPHCSLTLEPSIRQLRGNPAVFMSAFSDWSVPYFHLKNNFPSKHNILIFLFRGISRNWWIDWDISAQIRAIFQPSTILCMMYISGWKSILRFTKRNLLRLKYFITEDTSRSEILARDISQFASALRTYLVAVNPALRLHSQDCTVRFCQEGETGGNAQRSQDRKRESGRRRKNINKQ
jgi:hypothetical protein